MQSRNSCMCAIYPSVILHIICPLKAPAWTVTIVAGEISPLWFLNAFSNCLFEDMQSHISCICVIFSEVCFHMCSQTCLNRCKVTFVACVRFTQMLYFHMCSQIAFLNRCKVTIVACERFVSFHMSPQMAYLTRCKFTFVACVWFSNHLLEHMQCYISWYMLYSEMLVFKCLPKSPTWTDAKSH